MAPSTPKWPPPGGVVALKNGLNEPKIAEFVLYTEHSHTTVPKQSIFNADHIVRLPLF